MTTISMHGYIYSKSGGSETQKCDPEFSRLLAEFWSWTKTVCLKTPGPMAVFLVLDQKRGPEFSGRLAGFWFRTKTMITKCPQVLP